jgi:putative lipoic acid-binding regulatory protein
MSESDSDKLLQFPCSFPIKMMGRADESFSNTAVGLVEQHVGEVSPDSIQTSKSRNGNFLSVTVTIDAKSQEQLDCIYNDLSNHEDILIAL